MSKHNTMLETFADRRADAIRSGELIDVSNLARTADLMYPIAITRAVWEVCVAIPPEGWWQDATGRLWDMLTILRLAVLASSGLSEIRFEVLALDDRRQVVETALKAVFGPGDDEEPVITVMFPEED